MRKFDRKCSGAGATELRKHYRAQIAFVMAAGVSAAGCVGTADSLNSVSAEPIAIDSKAYQDVSTLPGSSVNKKREFLGTVVQDSEQKCNAFLGRLVFGETSLNLSTDIAATLFSALATAVTPPGTKSALSAAATIASGSKTAIDADLFNKAAIADFAAAIQRTYSADIRAYTDKLSTLPDTTESPLIVSNEIAKIQSYHAECGLAPAESAIQAKLSLPPAPETSKAPGGSKQGNKNGGRNNARLALPLTSTPTEQNRPSSTRAAIVGRGSW